MKVKVSKYVADRMSRTKKDFRVDTFCAGGKGGSNQNAKQSGVRITDLITGIAVDCREERKQEQNQSKAFYRLCDKLIEHYKRQENVAREVLRDLKKSASKAIRTYKLDKGIVIDHRTGKTYDAKRIVNGDLDKVMQDVLCTERNNT